MINASTNFDQVRISIARKVSAIDADRIMRTVAISTLATVKRRIHTDGLASDGKSIGTYSKGYMVVRTGAYKNAGRTSKGKSKGALKNAGYYTKQGLYSDTATHRVKKFGKLNSNERARIKYNRDNNKNVVLSLTRQMESDMSVIAIPGGYGIGYLNPLNFKKARWNEATYKKRIFSLTNSERETALSIAKSMMNL